MYAAYYLMRVFYKGAGSWQKISDAALVSYMSLKRAIRCTNWEKNTGVTVSALMFANPYVNVYNLQIGDELCIPKIRPIVIQYRLTNRILIFIMAIVYKNQNILPKEQHSFG